MKHIVYQTTNLVNGKIYVGVSNGKNSSYIGSGLGIKRALKKYGFDNFKRETLFECDDGDEAYWLERIIVNKEFIKFHDCYNAQVGGSSGYFHTEETRKKISESKIGKPRPPHVRKIMLENSKRIAKVTRKRNKTEKWRLFIKRLLKCNHKIFPLLNAKIKNKKSKQKMTPEEVSEFHRQRMLGTKLSEETKRKISKNNVQCKPVTILVNNKPLLTYRSIAQASRLTGYHENSIRHVVKGRTKTTGQWFGDKFVKVKWIYEKDS
jgi:group I intron endonuclease